MRRLAALFLALFLAGTAGAAPRQLGPQAYAPSELLVVFQHGAGLGPAKAAGRSFKIADERADLHAEAGVELLDRLDQADVHRVKIPAGMNEEAVKNIYLKNPLVKSVSRNGVMQALSCPFVGPNDTLYNTGYQNWYTAIDCDAAYSDWRGGCITLTSMVTVAVVDTGVYPHAELSGLLVDGYNFVTPGASTLDDHGHGTFVSGVIAALANNSNGPAGVFFDSSHIRIMPVKVLGSNGSGTDYMVLSGIVYAADHGAKVINMSLGEAFDDPAVENAVNYAYNQGVLLVAAAGNNSGATLYPAAFGNVMAVSALDDTDNKTYYSSYGKVEISAPGGDATSYCGCTSSPAGCSGEIWGLCNSPGNYTGEAGTSFASPMVAGAAALLLSQKSSRTNDDLSRYLINTAAPTAQGAGYHPETGWGKLDVDHALNYDGGPFYIPGTAQKVYNFPNPFRPSRDGVTNIVFSLPQGADTDLRIMDMSGDLVYEKKFDSSETQAGFNKKTWDGRNGTGRMVANGVYIVTVAADGITARNRIAVLK